MSYLEKIGFTSENINSIKENTPEVIFKLLDEKKKMVNANILYLKEIGVTNFKEIFVKYPDLFITDHSNFVETFAKYDQADLVEKLKENIDVFVYL